MIARWPLVVALTIGMPVVCATGLGDRSVENHTPRTARVGEMARGLRHDPFVRPAKPAPAPTPRSTKAQVTPTTSAPAPAFEYELRAIMRIDGGGMANVQGHLVAVGEHFEGYVLERLGEREAVFARGARRITLTLE